MGLDISILSVPRALATKPADANIGSRYDSKPRWTQVTHERNDWALHERLADLYYRRGGVQDDFNNVTVRLYRRDLRLLDQYLTAPIIEHMKKGRVVYAESSF